MGGIGDPELRVVIAGGGPAGLSVAVNMRSVDVVVYERARKLGHPPHCAGIVSPATAKRLGAIVPELVEAVYNRAVFLDGALREICSIEARPLAFKISRPGLEEYLASRAEALGHRVVRGAYVSGYSIEKGKRGLRVKIRLGSSVDVIEADWLVVATGAQTWWKSRGCKRLLGVEARVSLSKRIIDDSAFYTIHSTPLAPGFFAWVAPLHGGRVATLGLAGGTPGTLMERLKTLIGLVSKHFAPVSRVLEVRSGIILGGPPVEEVLQKHVAMIGDVLCASKPFTGGGLYAVSLLAKPLAEAIEKERFEPLRSIWHDLRRELLSQYLLTRMIRSRDRLVALALSTVCKELKGCKVDFDKHTSLVKCYLLKLAKSLRSVSTRR